MNKEPKNVDENTIKWTNAQNEKYERENEHMQDRVSRRMDIESRLYGCQQ